MQALKSFGLPNLSLALLFLSVAVQLGCAAPLPAAHSPSCAATSSRPPADEPAHVARWLMTQSAWGVVATTSAKRAGAAWANVRSVADENCTGVPLFFMSKLDETASDLAAEPRATLALAEAALPSGCASDAQDPTCAKLSLHGKIAPAANQAAARRALFAAHPEMARWPVSHGFRAYAMEISDVFVLSDYGGAKTVTVRDYLAAQFARS